MCHATLVHAGDVASPPLGHIRHVHGVRLLDGDHVVFAIQLCGERLVAGAFLVDVGGVVGAGAAALGQVVGAALVGDEDVVGAVLVEVQLVVRIGLADRGFVADA
ncbi:hypothetical protein D3C81_2040090 [compost metagenome]